MHTPTTGEHHPSLIDQVQARREELKRALPDVAEDDAATRSEIEGALAAVVPMLTGDLANLPDMVSRDLVGWLDRSKYIGVRAKPERAGRGTEPPKGRTGLEGRTGGLEGRTGALEARAEPPERRTGQPDGRIASPEGRAAPPEGRAAPPVAPKVAPATPAEVKPASEFDPT